jgi:hypothetical protein
VSPNATEWRELARTTGNGVEVALLRHESRDRAKLVVSDRRVCRHMDFELVADDAATAFERPFRDAASQLIPVTAAVTEGAMP